MPNSQVPTTGQPAKPAPTNDEQLRKLLNRLDDAAQDALPYIESAELNLQPLRKRGGPDPKLINVGANPSKKRLTTALLELTRDELRLEPESTPKTALRQARARLERQLREHRDRTAAAREAIAPSRTAPRRDGEYDEVMVTAMLDADPALRFAYDELTGPDPIKRCGPTPDRERPLATVFYTGLSMARPNYEDVYLQFQKEPLLRHAFNDPTGPFHPTAALKQMHQVLFAKDSSYLQHVLVDQFRRICELRNPDGSVKYPKAGTVVLTDATLMQANLPQRAPRDEADARAMRGERFKDTGWIKYTSTVSAKQERGETVTQGKAGATVIEYCHGWKMLALVDQDTGATMMADKFPADVNERDAAKHLIERFFELWPNFDRFKFLVGDSYYDNQIGLSEDLWFDWSIHPVFVRHGKYAKTLPYVEDNKDQPGIQGVPCCPIHTRNADGSLRPMKFKDSSDFITVEQRAKLGIARGETVKNRSARNRWVCDALGCTETATTNVRDDARVYTYLHRAGTHNRAQLRAAMLAQRNRVESCFATLKNSGLGAQGCLRARWAGDIEMRWLILVASCGHNARILAHDTGAYARALHEAISHGLIEAPNADTTFATREAATTERRRHIEPARPVSTWPPGTTLDRIQMAAPGEDLAAA